MKTYRKTFCAALLGHGALSILFLVIMVPATLVLGGVVVGLFAAILFPSVTAAAILDKEALLEPGIFVLLILLSSVLWAALVTFTLGGLRRRRHPCRAGSRTESGGQTEAETPHSKR